MIRLFVPHPLKAGAGVAPTVDQSRYLTAVMRLNVGDEILVFNGQDGEWRCSLTEAGKRGCLLRPRNRPGPGPRRPTSTW
jgi:16S rRNA (uracil1498-N3)-methyltransferase